MIEGLIEEGISLRKISKICKVERNTLARFLKTNEITYAKK